MDHRKEVQEKLGKANVDLFYDLIEKGKITKTTLRNMAPEMHENVKSAYEANKQEKLLDLAQCMFDSWYENELSRDDVDGVSRLKEIFEEKLVGLGYLSNKIRPINGELTLGLPKEHTRIQGPTSKPTVTGQPAIVTDQGPDPVCAGHAVAKAIVEIIDDYGFNCEEEQIRDQLVSSGKAKNPDEFEKDKIKVLCTKQGSGNLTRKIFEFEIGVQTVASSVGDDYTFNSTPEIHLPKDMKMVVRWDIGETLWQENIKG